MIAIATSAEDAALLVAAIDAVLGYPRNGTTTHDVPRKHPAAAEWAVSLDGLDTSSVWLSEAIAGLEIVSSLPSDWFPAGYA